MFCKHMLRTFINYRRDDAAAEAQLIAESLRRAGGKHAVFMDSTSIDPGAKWPDRIRLALEESHTVIVVIGPGWLRAGINEWGQRRIDIEADWVRREIATTQPDCQKVLIPVLFGGGRMPPKSTLPLEIADLADRQTIEFRREYWNHDISLLTSQLFVSPNVQMERHGTLVGMGSNPITAIWELLDPALQDVFALAANAARREGKDIISTRTLFAALRRLHPGSLTKFFAQVPSDALPDALSETLPLDRDALNGIKLMSSCVQKSLENLSLQATTTQPLTSEDVFIDIARHGKGDSVRRLRIHVVDEERINEIVRQLGWSVVDRRTDKSHNQAVNGSSR